MLIVNDRFRNRPRRLAGVALFALLAAACAGGAAGGEAALPLIASESVAKGGEAPPDGLFELDAGAAAGDAVFFGVILTQACFWQPDGMPSCVDGMLLRLREVNRNGGLDGRQVRVIAVMDRDSDAGNVRAADLLRGDARVVAVLGPHSSGPSRAVIDAMPAGGGLGFFSSTATGDGLVTADGWFFSALWPDATQASAMARYLANEKGLKLGAVVVEEHSAYSKNLGRAFQDAFAAAGGESREIRLPSRADGDLDLDVFADPVARIRDAGAQFVYIPCSAQHVARLVRQAGRLELPADVVLCGGDTWDHADVYGGGGNRLEGCLFTSPMDPDHSDARLDAFRRDMALTHDDIRNITLDPMLSYDTMDMMLAAARAADATRGGVRRGWFMLRDLPLITGNTSVSADGLIRRDICLLRIEAKDDGYAASLLERIPSE